MDLHQSWSCIQLEVAGLHSVMASSHFQQYTKFSVDLFKSGKKYNYNVILIPYMR